MKKKDFAKKGGETQRHIQLVIEFRELTFLEFLDLSFLLFFSGISKKFERCSWEILRKSLFKFPKSIKLVNKS